MKSGHWSFSSTRDQLQPKARSAYFVMPTWLSSQAYSKA
jgi:hypothetical protein